MTGIHPTIGNRNPARRVGTVFVTGTREEAQEFAEAVRTEDGPSPGRRVRVHERKVCAEGVVATVFVVVTTYPEEKAA